MATRLLSDGGGLLRDLVAHEAQQRLDDLLARPADGGPSLAAASGPDLNALLRQVAAMAAERRSEGRSDERIDRIMSQMERLAASVEATERAMKRLEPRAAVAALAAPGTVSVRPRAAGNLELFRAILEQNLALHAQTAA
jgi:hypothetical protein